MEKGYKERQEMKKERNNNKKIVVINKKKQTIKQNTENLRTNHINHKKLQN